MHSFFLAFARRRVYDSFRGERMNECERCVYFVCDEVTGEYYCDVYLDEDEAGRLMERAGRACPYFRDGDDYAVVRRQN